VIKSEFLYYLECDGCGHQPEDFDTGGADYWPDQASMLKYAADTGWTTGSKRHHCPECPPLDLLGVGLVKWTEYPSERDRRNGTNGTGREGQYVGAAPGGRWAVTTDQKFHLVKTRAGVSWSIAEECPT
jgi:hypothetical protein